MPFVHGKATVIKVDNSAGTLTDLSAYCNSVSMPRSISDHDTTAFGASDEAHITGLKGASVSLGGNFDPVLDTHMSALLGLATTTTIEFNPAGITAGLPKFTAETNLLSYDVETSVGDLVTWSAEFKVTGAVTRALNV